MARTKDFDEADVLTKAIRLFWQKGYNGTSMQDLVDALGISRSSLYDTFGDKRKLYLKALESYKQTEAANRAKIFDKSIPARTAIRHLLDFIILDQISDKQHKGCFLINCAVETSPKDKQVNAILCENDREIENALHEVIQRGQNSGEITGRYDAKTIARFIFNNIVGMRVSGKLATDKSMFEDTIQLTMSVLD